MKRDLTFLVAGLLLGALSISIGNQLKQTFTSESDLANSAAPVDKTEQPAELSSYAEVTPKPNRKLTQIATSNLEQTSQRDAGVAETADKTVNLNAFRSPVPEPYDTMLKPRALPKKLRTTELYERFVAEPRDNSWADAMELGIQQYISDRGPELEMTFEYVECRSRYCVITGVSYGADNSPWNTYNHELGSSGWWLASGGASTVGGTFEDGTRFATVISRTPSDTLRESTENNPHEKTNESSTQTVASGMSII